MGERPKPDADTFECHIELVEAACADPAAVLGRCREVLRLVLGVVAEVDAGERALPSVDGWRQLLPAWFVDACGPESSDGERRAGSELLDRLPRDVAVIIRRHAPWSLSRWVEPFTRGRPWFWWDAEVVDSSRLRVWHAVWDLPYAEGTLRWLLLAAGARTVEFAWQK